MSIKWQKLISAKYGWLIILFLVALGANVWWLSADVENREPIAVVLALVFAAYGLASQIIVPAREKRRNQLLSLVHEMMKNISILNSHYLVVPDDVEKIFSLPRLHIWATETLLTSGVIHHEKDRELFNSLHDWHDRTVQINSKLIWSESRFISADAETKKNIYQSIVELRAMQSHIECTTALGRLLLSDRYAGEHQISETTIVFQDDAKIRHSI